MRGAFFWPGVAMAALSLGASVPWVAEPPRVAAARSASPAAPVTSSTQAAVTSVLGTKVEWEQTPALAFERARSTNRLVFLLHLSGNFATPAET